MFWLVWLFVFGKKGENAKEKMSWANVIRELKEIMTLGCWNTINGLNFLEQNLTTARCRFLKKQTNKIKQTNDKNQTRTVKEKDASFSHSVAVLLTQMLLKKHLPSLIVRRFYCVLHHFLLLSVNSFYHFTFLCFTCLPGTHYQHSNWWEGNFSPQHTLSSTYHHCSRGVSWSGWCRWEAGRGSALTGRVYGSGACWPVWCPRCTPHSQSSFGCYNRKKNNRFVLLSHEYSRSNYKYSAPTDLSEMTSKAATMSLCNFQINREVKQTPGMRWHQQNKGSKLRAPAFTFEQPLQLGQWTPLYKCHDSLVWTWLNWIKGP